MQRLTVVYQQLQIHHVCTWKSADILAKGREVLTDPGQALRLCLNQDLHRGLAKCPVRINRSYIAVCFALALTVQDGLRLDWQPDYSSLCIRGFIWRLVVNSWIKCRDG